MLGYGQQAGGTHPTGMHSCAVMILLSLIIMADVTLALAEFNISAFEPKRITLSTEQLQKKLKTQCKCYIF